MVTLQQNIDNLLADVVENKKHKYSHKININQIKVEQNGQYNFSILNINNSGNSKDCFELLINKNTEINLADIDLRICQLNA